MAQEAAECWADHGARERPLREAAHHEVDVLVAAVHGLQQPDGVRLHGVVELGEGGDGGQAAVLPHLAVGGQPVVPPGLDDGGDLVNSEIWKKIDCNMDGDGECSLLK